MCTTGRVIGFQPVRTAEGRVRSIVLFVYPVNEFRVGNVAMWCSINSVVQSPTETLKDSGGASRWHEERSDCLETSAL